MLVTTLIILATAFFLGFFSTIYEKLFIAIIFLGFPACAVFYNVLTRYNVVGNVDFYWAYDTNQSVLGNVEQFFAAIPDNFRTGLILSVPVFFIGRTAIPLLIKRHTDNYRSPEALQKRKRKIQSSYRMDT